MLREREMPPDITTRQETPQDSAAVERLYAVAFGPGRYARTAFRLRGDAAPDPATSFVADRRGLIIGAIRQVRAQIAGAPAYLLGPLAVAETAAKQGIGKALLARTVAAADAAGAAAIVLIGDEPFYAASGFSQVPAGAIWMNAPTEAHRLLFRTPDGSPPPSGRLAVLSAPV